MNRFTNFLIILSIYMCTSATTDTAFYNLKVVVTGMSNNGGQMLAALYNNASSYPDNPLVGQIQSIQSLKSVIVFSKLSKGIYAVSIFHDANNNKKLDQNAIGIPTEAYGFSNNPNSKLGPPSFKKVSFPLRSDTTIYITVKKFI